MSDLDSLASWHTATFTEGINGNIPVFTEIQAIVNPQFRHLVSDIEDVMSHVEEKTGVEIKLTRRRYVIVGDLEQIKKAKTILEETIHSPESGRNGEWSGASSEHQLDLTVLEHQDADMMRSFSSHRVNAVNGWNVTGRGKQGMGTRWNSQPAHMNRSSEERASMISQSTWTEDQSQIKETETREISVQTDTSTLDSDHEEVVNNDKHGNSTEKTDEGDYKASAHGIPLPDKDHPTEDEDREDDLAHKPKPHPFPDKDHPDQGEDREDDLAHKPKPHPFADKDHSTESKEREDDSAHKPKPLVTGVQRYLIESGFYDTFQDIERVDQPEEHAEDGNVALVDPAKDLHAGYEAINVDSIALDPPNPKESNDEDPSNPKEFNYEDLVLDQINDQHTSKEEVEVHAETDIDLSEADKDELRGYTDDQSDDERQELIYVDTSKIQEAVFRPAVEEIESGDELIHESPGEAIHPHHEEVKSDTATDDVDSKFIEPGKDELEDDDDLDLPFGEEVLVDSEIWEYMEEQYAQQLNQMKDGLNVNIMTRRKHDEGCVTAYIHSNNPEQFSLENLAKARDEFTDMYQKILVNCAQEFFKIPKQVPMEAQQMAFESTIMAFPGILTKKSNGKYTFVGPPDDTKKARQHFMKEIGMQPNRAGMFRLQPAKPHKDRLLSEVEYYTQMNNGVMDHLQCNEARGLQEQAQIAIALEKADVAEAQAALQAQVNLVERKIKETSTALLYKIHRHENQKEDSGRPLFVDQNQEEYGADHDSMPALEPISPLSETDSPLFEDQHLSGNRESIKVAVQEADSAETVEEITDNSHGYIDGENEKAMNSSETKVNGMDDPDDIGWLDSDSEETDEQKIHTQALNDHLQNTSDTIKPTEATDMSIGWIEEEDSSEVSGNLHDSSEIEVKDKHTELPDVLPQVRSSTGPLKPESIIQKLREGGDFASQKLIDAMLAAEDIPKSRSELQVIRSEDIPKNQSEHHLIRPEDIPKNQSEFQMIRPEQTKESSPNPSHVKTVLKLKKPAVIPDCVDEDPDAPKPTFQPKLQKDGSIVSTCDAPICTNCVEPMNRIVKLECGHEFCVTCVRNPYRMVDDMCPVCGEKFSRETLKQPEGGLMTHIMDKKTSLPNFSKHGTMMVKFSFQEGIIQEDDEDPKPYARIDINTFLPCNTDGKALYKMLFEAHEARRLFKVTYVRGCRGLIVTTRGITLKADQDSITKDYLARLTKELKKLNAE